jgi:ATP-dependent DNA ligase
MVLHGGCDIRRGVIPFRVRLPRGPVDRIIIRVPGFAITPPVEPMLSRVAETIPPGPFLYEPKWDGFRALVFRGGGDVFIQSRDLKPLDRYFPELHDSLIAALPDGCVVDGEIVIATRRGLDFDLLQMRLHPAASRAAKLAKETPSSFVAFDLLAAGGKDLRAQPFERRRAQLETLLARAKAPVHLTPVTRDRDVAVDWLQRFEGAGLDGVMAKPASGAYEPGKRVMFKIKHARTADCVVAGFRWHKGGEGERIGSLLLGLYDDKDKLHHVGVASAFSTKTREALVALLEPLRTNAMKDHPWKAWAAQDGSTRMPGGQSRWSAGKDLSWEPIRVELVCEVKYDHMQGDRFRHAAFFQRWRHDKQPSDCTYAQLDVTTPFELARVFATQSD